MAEVSSGALTIVLDDEEVTALRDVLQGVENRVGLPADLDELADAIGVTFPRTLPLEDRAAHYEEGR